MRLHAFASIALTVIAGCGDDPATTTDTSDVTHADTTADTTADTSADTTADSDERDADSVAFDSDVATADSADASDLDEISTPGRSVAGTALEGVAIEWTETLDLCSAWTEGASLADEKARKLHVRIAPQARASLDEDDLKALDLSTVAFWTGPDAAQRLLPDGDTVTVPTWQLLQTGGGDHFAAEVHHDLGPAGTLIESFAVSRAPGTPTPVVITPESYEHTFAWQPVDHDLYPVLLQRCGGAPDYEDAVSVAVGVDAGKKSWATLVRYWRTTPGGGVDAGSYAVALVGHRLVTSDAAWSMNDAWEQWSQTYVAKHHNWDDDSEVDFRRDLGAWHTFFRAPEAGLTRVASVTLEGLLTPRTDATMTIVRQTDGVLATEVLPVPEPNAFVRVDAAQLGRSLTCAGGEAGEVLAAGAADHLVQLLFCPGSGPGDRDLVAVVPVVWGSDPTLATERFEAVTSITGGWSVAIGDHTLTLVDQGGGAIASQVEDAAHEVVSSSYEVPYPLAPPFPRSETLTAAKDDIALVIERRWAGFGVGKSQLWAPVRFSLTFGGVTREVVAWDRLTYTNTHHNWEDELEGVADDGVVLHWHTSFQSGVVHQVSATSADGATLLAPTDLGR